MQRIASDAALTDAHFAISLVDLKGNDSFAKACSLPVSESVNVEQIDPATLRVLCPEGELTVFKGQQMNTKEGLEVIVYGSEGTIPDHRDLAYYQDLSSDFIVTLPWGVGKWLGKRGKFVRAFHQHSLELSRLAPDKPAYFFLGDNGGRPWWWRESLLQDEQMFGRHAMSGSDALPTSTYQARLGTYGDLYCANVNTFNVWRHCLLESDKYVGSFGKLNSNFSFWHEQISIRLSKPASADKKEGGSR